MGETKWQHFTPLMVPLALVAGLFAGRELTAHAQKPTVEHLYNAYHVDAKLTTDSKSSVIARGMTVIHLSVSEAMLCPGETVEASFGGKTTSARVISSGPFPDVGFMVSPQEAKEMRDAKNIKLVITK